MSKSPTEAVLAARKMLDDKEIPAPVVERMIAARVVYAVVFTESEWDYVIECLNEITGDGGLAGEHAEEIAHKIRWVKHTRSEFFKRGDTYENA